MRSRQMTKMVDSLSGRAVGHVPEIFLPVLFLLIGAVHTPPVLAQSTVAVFVQTNPTLNQQILVDAVGMTLYVYARDTTDMSTCTDQCATIWPPVQPTGGLTPTLIGNATGTLSTITRTDGTMQVEYNGMPLYYYSRDMSPGDVNGQGIANVWSAATP
jgi:predicted lipoprotein with Yx(FWY)xxD motif